MMRNSMKKLYRITKYVAAESVLDALQKDRKTPAHDVYIEDRWIAGNSPFLNKSLGLPTDIDDEGTFKM